jgi:hypothetical protein
MKGRNNEGFLQGHCMPLPFFFCSLLYFNTWFFPTFFFSPYVKNKNIDKENRQNMFAGRRKNTIPLLDKNRRTNSNQMKTAVL